MIWGPRQSIQEDHSESVSRPWWLNKLANLDSLILGYKLLAKVSILSLEYKSTLKLCYIAKSYDYNITSNLYVIIIL